MNWLQTATDLLEDFGQPLAAGEFPSIAQALDDGIDDRLRDALAEPSPINPRYVENLLTDCVNRIANCLILKEKANEIEVRAIGDAISYRLQSASISADTRIRELLTPVQERLGANATGSKPNGASTEFVGDKKLWAAVRKFQTDLSEANSSAAEAWKVKASTPGNGSNYVERFRLVKTLFELGIVEAYRRCIVCARGLKAVYGIDIKVPPVSSAGYLNELAIWGQKASDLLDIELDGRFSSEVVLSIGAISDAKKSNELITRTAFNAGLAAGTVNFDINENIFELLKLKSPLMRSVRFQLKVKADDAKTRFLTLQVRPPADVLTPGENVLSCTSSTQYQDAEGNETNYGVRNLKPTGDWSIRLPELMLVTGEATATDIVHIFMFLRVSAKR